MTPTTLQKEFLQTVSDAFQQSNVDFARAYYLFATAKLADTYDSQAIYNRYPLLQDEATFRQIKPLYDANPDDEEVKRLFVSTLGSYIGNKLAAASDELDNLKNTLEVDVSGLNLNDKDGKPVDRILYEDTSEWFKRLEDKGQREALYERVTQAYTTAITPKFIELFHAENQLFADLGYEDLIAFYSQTSGHDLQKLGRQGHHLVAETDALYRPLMGAFYTERTGQPFEAATRADIPYVFHGKSDATADIDTCFPQSRLVSLATETFDRLGLQFSALAAPVDFKTEADHRQTVEDPNRKMRILLDIAPREGKRSRAYVYPARAPEEIYLSVKPEGGLDDYAAFFHESGHALHFAYIQPGLSYPLAMMGNNTVTESYAYLMQNLFLNHHWLVNQAGLSPEQASRAIRRGALNDLYMLRRYASKMQFELRLFDGTGLGGKPEHYAMLLTQGTGFRYDADGWSRDVDAGFYVADYFTAWTLEAQLRAQLEERFGQADAGHEDWYTNPEAGEFLKQLWQDGNLTQADLSARLGYNDPTDVRPLLALMQKNLVR